MLQHKEKINMDIKARNIILKGLEQLRKKLLDISGRNPLISFRHFDRSKGQIRAINTSLEDIYIALQDEKDVIFKPLPVPTEGILNVNESELTIHLTPEKHALSLGINPSYELQFKYDNKADDIVIQTLLFPDKFLKKMTNFLDVQKQNIEETGVNCMHACFGFLEWYESSSSKQAIISPILMIPICVEREFKHQQSIFQLRSTGEETRDNPALAERLKNDFGLQLPCITKNTNIQNYFSELRSIIKDQPRWKVIQQLTIGKVSFAKILMYFDLNPNNWPEDDSIFDQPLVRDLFIGAESPVSSGFAADDHLDETDQASPVPLVISDLDSSQLSAVADAMNQKSFVIEGPPGTGKSQTITNIIAAAMADGKSVLFVAEKLVALQVVKNRLDDAGLGQFCLELHSTKIQKGKFYEELKTRLELKDGSDNKLSKKLDLKIKDHREMKHQLNLYASTMGMTFGTDDLTLHEYFWLYQKQKNELPQLFTEDTGPIFFKNASNLPKAELLTFKDCAVQWITFNRDMCTQFGSLKKHPWNGFQLKIIGTYQLNEILQRIDLLKNNLKSLNQFAETCSADIPDQKVATLSDLFKINDDLQYISNHLNAFSQHNQELFSLIDNPNDVSFIHEHVQQKQEISTLTEGLKRFVNISDQTPEELQKLIEDLNLLHSKALQEKVGEWAAFQIDAVLQATNPQELPTNFPIEVITTLFHSIQENHQKWQILEKDCLLRITHSSINLELINSLKSLQMMSETGCFAHISHGKWKGLHQEICAFLQAPNAIPQSNDSMLSALSQELIIQKNKLEELKSYIDQENIFTDLFAEKFDTFLDRVRSTKNCSVTLSDLHSFQTERISLKNQWEAYKKSHSNIIHSFAPNWTGTLSLKVLRLLCGAYMLLANTPRAILRLRTNDICNEINHYNLREAISKYEALRQVRLDIETSIRLDMDSSKLKDAILGLKNAGIFSWFKKATRNAKRIFQENQLGNLSLSNNEMLLLFEKLLKFKNEHALFTQESRFNIFLNTIEKIGESRLGELSDLVDWSSKINELLRGNDSLLLSTKRFIFDADLSDLDSFIEILDINELKQCLEDFSAHSGKSTIDDLTDNLNKDIASLQQLHVAAKEVGYKPNISLNKATDAYTIYCNYLETQERVKAHTQKLQVQSELLASAITARAEIGFTALSESLSTHELIELVEQCEFWKEETRKSEGNLCSKKEQLRSFPELCSKSLLCQNIPFTEISQIIQKLQNLKLAVSNLTYSAKFSSFCEIANADCSAKTLLTCQLYMDLINNGISQPLLKYLQNMNLSERLATLQLHHSFLLQPLPQSFSELESIIEDGEIDTNIWFGKGAILERPLTQIIDKLENVHVMREHLQEWIQLNILEDKLRQCGIHKLCALILRHQLDVVLIPAAIDYIFYQSILTLIQKEYPIVNQLEYNDLTSLRERFAEVDQQLIGLYRKLAAAKIMEREVDSGTKQGSRREWTEKALIELEVSKKRKHRPIRELLQGAGNAMQALKPCFMMSPLSVVQYLAPGELKFDLIIIDEASQVKPEDAIGTLARGKQVIIVGDPKQLPPTDFWKKGGDLEEDDENEDIGNEESILDLAMTVYQPMRRLRWHYRSQHESLINFSNKEFYDNNLIIFPSPNFGDSKLGLSYQYVEGAQYMRGGDKTNSIEAERLVDAVEIFMRDHPDRSIGIITMNVPQRELINELMNARFSESSITEAYRVKWSETLERFFVKNLENVQGDERDIIFISTVYGKEGVSSYEKLNQNFGPINKANGHRRLNVMFTRAKQKMVIFSSLDPDEIRVTEESPRGLRVFKEYLRYAKTGHINISKITGRDYGSEFESAVAKHIKNWGYEVDSQVGVGGYFLDLAVVHPHKPGKHMLAIECDGATYHSSRSARDRDRLRQQALERMGWCIHRIWSTDWFRNPRSQLVELKKILQFKAGEGLDHSSDEV